MNRDLAKDYERIINDNYSNPRWSSEIYKSSFINFLIKIKSKYPQFEKIFNSLKLRNYSNRIVKFFHIVKINKKLKKFFK